MRIDPEFVRARRRLLPFIRFALDDGWQVSRSRVGRLTFFKAGLPTIYAGFPASSAKARILRRTECPMDHIDGKEVSDG